jgi:inner membrane protein
MPTIITHAVAAWAGGRSILKSIPEKLLLTGVLCSMLPDADVIGFSFGISYDSMWGHRGITHSFFFAVMLAALTAPFFRNIKWKAFLFIFLATVSHPVLDAFTNGGRGVAFFAPFSAERYFFPWTPIKVSPLGASRFFSEYGLSVLWSEIRWVWAPFLLLMQLTEYIRKSRTDSKHN